MNWADFKAIIASLPASSALVRKLDPDRAAWGLAEHLTAAAVDVLNILAWQNTENGRKGRNRPRPIPRPGIVDDRVKITTIGKGNGLTRSQMDAWIAQRVPRASTE